MGWVVNTTPWLLHPPRKETLHSLYRRLVGTQGQSGWVQKILPPPGLDPWTVQPVGSRNTDLAIPANKI